ncbi:MAG: SPASM domain-containing protein [Bacteroidales bacterium]|nr:SPASM domain-containing protein [Bacteroidales bacterium]
MKWSKYNYIFDSKKHGKFLYNSFMNFLWKINDDIYEDIIKIKKNHYSENKDDKLIKLLIANRILVEKNNVDCDNFIFQNQLKAFEKGYLSYTIMPTLDCNFRCPYCFEDNVNQKSMTEEVELKTIRYIKKNAKCAKLLNVTWYGGEPLLKFDSIKRISKELVKLKLSYNASMVTNGYLLNENVISQLKDLHINSLQITIDGLEETHNLKRPHYKNNDSFSRIILNLDKLFSKKESKIRVALRINVDNDNAEEFIEIYKFLEGRYGEKVFIYPGIIKDWSGKADGFSCGFNKKEEVAFRIEQYEKHGLKPINFFPTHTAPCVAERVYDYVIGPEGELYKCWNDVGKSDFIVGSIFNDKANVELLTKYLVSVDSFKSEKCKDCFFLFVCGGGCPSQKLRNKFDGTSFDTCTYFKYNLDKFLEIHFELKNIDEIKELTY